MQTSQKTGDHFWCQIQEVRQEQGSTRESLTKMSVTRTPGLKNRDFYMDDMILGAVAPCFMEQRCCNWLFSAVRLDWTFATSTSVDLEKAPAIFGSVGKLRCVKMFWSMLGWDFMVQLFDLILKMNCTQEILTAGRCSMVLTNILNMTSKWMLAMGVVFELQDIYLPTAGIYLTCILPFRCRSERCAQSDCRRGFREKVGDFCGMAIRSTVVSLYNGKPMIKSFFPVGIWQPHRVCPVWPHFWTYLLTSHINFLSISRSHFSIHTHVRLFLSSPSFRISLSAR